MSFSTIRAPLSQLPSNCPHCDHSFEPDKTFRNAFRRGDEKKTKVIAHKVDGFYHAYHPACFQQVVDKAHEAGANPRCGLCHLEIETIDGLHHAADPDMGIDNSPKSIATRGLMLVYTAQANIILGAKSKRHEIQMILAGGRVLTRDLQNAAISLASKAEFDCIPDLINRGEPFNQSSRDTLFEIALQFYDWPTVRLMLPQGISEYQQEQGLLHLARYGDIAILNALLQKRGEEGRLFPAPIMEEAVALASRRGEVDLVRALLDHQGDLTEPAYENAISQATQSEEDPLLTCSVVQLLLERGELSGYTRTAAIAKAVANGRFDIAWALSPSFSMPSYQIL